MFKKRAQKGQKRSKAAAPEAGDAPDAPDAAEALEATRNAQYWRKRARGLGADRLGASEKAAAPPPAEAEVSDSIDSRLKNQFDSRPDEAGAPRDAALASYIAARLDGAAAGAPAPAPSAEEALYVVPKLDITDISKDVEKSFELGGLDGAGATGASEVDLRELDERQAAARKYAAARRAAAAALPVSSAVPVEVRERLLEASMPAPATLKGRRGPHLWLRGDEREERMKALALSRADRTAFVRSKPNQGRNC